MADGVTVLSETICQLGEGPSYDPAGDTLFWFDIVDKKLLQKPMGGGDTTIHPLPVMASALGVVDEERQLLVIEYGKMHRDIVARFGRFPHRNKALGRRTTRAEAAFLRQPNSSF